MSPELSIRINRTIRDFFNEHNPPAERDTVNVDETLTALRCIFRGYYDKLEYVEQVKQLKLMGNDLGLRLKDG